jgi:hypothetical protein
VWEKHDQDCQGKVNDCARQVNQQAIVQVTDDGCLHDEVQMWWLQPDEAAQQGKCLQASLLLHELNIDGLQ